MGQVGWKSKSSAPAVGSILTGSPPNYRSPVPSHVIQLDWEPVHLAENSNGRLASKVECNVVKLSAVSSPFGCWNIIKQRQEHMSPSNSCLLDGVCTSRRIPQPRKQFLGAPLTALSLFVTLTSAETYPRSTLLICRRGQERP